VEENFNLIYCNVLIIEIIDLRCCFQVMKKLSNSDDFDFHTNRKEIYSHEELIVAFTLNV